MRYVPLENVLSEIVSGVSPVCEERAAGADEIGVLKLSAITGGQLDLTAAKAIAPDLVQPSWPRVSAGTVLITRASGSKDLVGACVMAPLSCDRRIVPDTAWQLAVDESSGVSARWIVEYLRSPAGRRAINQIARGTSGIWKITKEGFRRIQVPLPNRDRMNAVTSALVAHDRRISACDGLLAAKRAFKRALLHELLTGQRRFSEFAADAWVTARLGDLFAERNEVGAEAGRLLSVTADRGVIPRDELDRRDTSSADKSKYKRVLPGDIAYNTMRMWQGVSGIVRHAGIVSPAYTVLNPRGPLSSEYAKHLFKHPKLVHTFWRYSQGLVDDTLSLKYPNFARIPVSYPSSTQEQERIARVLDNADREIALLERQSAAYEAQKRALMHRLLSGDLSLPAPAAPPALAHA